MSNNPSPIRVLHCPNTVGGNPGSLARHERELGLLSHSVTLKNKFSFPVDEQINSNKISLLGKRYMLYRRALTDFDIVHFNFGMTIFPMRVSSNFKSFSGLLKKIYNVGASFTELRDLELLKKHGKKIVVTFQGDDARQAKFCRENFDINLIEENADYYTEEMDRFKRQRIKKFSEYADVMFALNPDLMHVLPKQTKFMAYGHIDLSEWTPKYPLKSYLDKPMIVHAPSNRDVKGTKYIIEAVSRLKNEGLDFDFTLVENLAHHKTKELYQKADLLIDQLFAGWYGGLSVEFMALGKAVMCYIREDDLKFIPKDMAEELPVINVNKSSLYSLLKEWLTVRKGQLQEQGIKSRKYTEQWHDPVKICSDLKLTYESILGQ